MIKWNKTYTFLTVGVIISAAIIYGICYVTIIKPLQEELHSVEKQADMFETRLDSLTNQEVVVDEGLLEAGLKIPRLKSPDNVLINLQALATNSNVTITSISSAAGEAASEEEESINRTNYSLEITGENLEQVHEFLDAILESERLMTISNMSIYQREDSVALTLTVITYHASKAG